MNAAGLAATAEGAGSAGRTDRTDRGRADRRWHPSRVLDVVIAAITAVLVTLGVWAELAGWPTPVVFPAGAYAIGLASAAALLFRRQWPFASTVAVLALMALYHFVGYPGAAPAQALFVAVFTLAETATTVWWIVVAVLAVGVWQVIVAVPPNATEWTSYSVTGPAVGMLFFIAIGIAARQLRRARAREVELARVEAEAKAREHIAQDRLRIARDVHDVLSHTISAIAVQSAAAIDAFDADEPGRARAAVTSIRSLARQATPELHRAVEFLRGEGGESPLEPQPTLADLDIPVRAAREAGLIVRVNTSGDLAAVPVMISMTAFRILQEAITNVIKHAGARSLDVSVRVSGTSLVVEVVDDGTGPIAAPESAPAPAGFGLRGMRERAASIGGSVSIGRDGGGFLVRAQLPVPELAQGEPGAGR